jgi:plasmid stabilization system protein ParE
MEPDEIVYSVVVAPAVNDRMAEHFAFLARVAETAALRLLDALARDMRSLSDMPYRNPPYDRPYLQAGKYRYMLSGKGYLNRPKPSGEENA